KCCQPCTSQVVPPGCPANDADPACSQGEYLSTNEDSMNLRCFHQVQRFGIDLLYPVQRYIEGLTQRLVIPRNDGRQEPNPIYAGVRDPSMVYLLGIVGVPWQDVATSDSLASDSLNYMTASELVQNGRWDVMLGDPTANVPPTDPFMIES